MRSMPTARSMLKKGLIYLHRGATTTEPQILCLMSGARTLAAETHDVGALGKPAWRLSRQERTGKWIGSARPRHALRAVVSQQGVQRVKGGTLNRE